MPTVDEFRAALLSWEPEDIVDRWIVSPGALHVDEQDRAHIAVRLSEAYRRPVERIEIVITGSAKLGFSMTRKAIEGQPSLVRYRSFRPESDIDVAVISPDIFDLLWSELSAHSHSAPRFPWQSRKLGDYLICGWLRPDHFPTNAGLRYCDLWWETFRGLSRDPRYRRHRVRGGLFYSMDELKRYSRRAVIDCALAEETE